MGILFLNGLRGLQQITVCPYCDRPVGCPNNPPLKQRERTETPENKTASKSGVHGFA